MRGPPEKAQGPRPRSSRETCALGRGACGGAWRTPKATLGAVEASVAFAALPSGSAALAALSPAPTSPWRTRRRWWEPGSGSAGRAPSPPLRGPFLRPRTPGGGPPGSVSPWRGASRASRSSRSRRPSPAALGRGRGAGRACGVCLAPCPSGLSPRVADRAPCLPAGLRPRPRRDRSAPHTLRTLSACRAARASCDSGVWGVPGCQLCKTCYARCEEPNRREIRLLSPESLQSGRMAQYVNSVLKERRWGSMERGGGSPRPEELAVAVFGGQSVLVRYWCFISVVLYDNNCCTENNFSSNKNYNSPKNETMLG